MPGAIIIGQGGSGSGGSGGGNASVGLTGATAPTSATEIGIISGGLLQGVSAVNPIPITGSITASNPSVGLTGATAPTSATEIGVIDGSGHLVGASSSNPVRIDPTGTTIQPISGTVTATIASVGLTAATAPTSANELGLIAITTALPTAVSSGQLIGGASDKYGRIVVLPQTTRDLVGVQTTQIASSNSETTIVTSATGVFNDITGMQITNASATAVTVTIKDATAGTTRKVFDLAANGGIVVHFSPPLPQAAVTNNWTATLSINTVTVDINVDFVKNK